MRTPKGYERAHRGGRLRLLHNWIWEQAHGPIPTGLQVHHVNEDKTDNRLENLELVDALTHKRIHSPHYRRAADETWERRCTICRRWKPADGEHFYLTREGWIAYGRCRPCHIGRVVEDKRRRRARERATA